MQKNPEAPETPMEEETPLSRRVLFSDSDLLWDDPDAPNMSSTP